MRLLTTTLGLFSLLAVVCTSFGSRQAVAGPVATAAPAVTSPLKEIGHVRATTRFCQDVLDRGGLATSAALADDSALEDTAHYLGTVELDDNQMAKYTTISALQARYAALMDRALSAVEETKRLRALAESAPTADQKAALVAYANALGGALHRQQLDAEYYRRFVMYLEQHDPVSWQQRDHDLFYAARTPLAPSEHSADPRDRVPPTLTEVSRSEGIQVEDRHQKVIDDEVRAAGYAQAAFGPCKPDIAPDSPAR